MIVLNWHSWMMPSWPLYVFMQRFFGRCSEYFMFSFVGTLFLWFPEVFFCFCSRRDYMAPFSNVTSVYFWSGREKCNFDIVRPRLKNWVNIAHEKRVARFWVQVLLDRLHRSFIVSFGIPILFFAFEVMKIRKLPRRLAIVTDSNGAQSHGAQKNVN